MILTEAEADSQLRALRGHREDIDRQIADLALYLELGRRLGMSGASASDDPECRGTVPGLGQGDATSARASGSVRASMQGASPSADGGGSETEMPSEAAMARRYGRALIEAAQEILRQEARPLHASEILAGLSARGFALPGHDPVAALNTRLWKRAGSGGALRRLGDATYALAEEDAATGTS